MPSLPATPRSAPPPTWRAEWRAALRSTVWAALIVPPVLTTLTIGPGSTAAHTLRVFAFNGIAGLALLVSITGVYAALWSRVPPQLHRVARYGLHAGVIAIGITLGIELAALVSALAPLDIEHAHARALLWRAAPLIAASISLVALLLDRLRAQAQREAERAEAARRDALQARFEALQARTDPHFLFNSLNTVAALIGEDPARAEDAVERLADLFRYALDAGRRDAVPLRVELDAVADYLALQHLRFEERLDAELQVEPDDGVLDGVRVPPLLLQPVVENAVVHGLTDRPLRVRVRAERVDGGLRLSVHDDGRGFGRSARAGTGTGLSTLRDRLRLRYGARATVDVHSAPDAGSRVEIHLPLAAGDPEDRRAREEDA